MTTPPRRWRALWRRVSGPLAAAGLVLLTLSAWLSVAYVCGRKVFAIQDAHHFMRLLLPGIW